MSKKLLMNNYSESGLMPVTDGLMCWLDGRDGKIGDTIWKDRSGKGNDAEIIGCEWTGTSLKINDRGANEFLIDKKIEGNYTMEVYFKSNNSANYNEKIKIITANNMKMWQNANSLYITNTAPQFLISDVGFTRLTKDFTNNSPYYIATTRENNTKRKIFVNNNEPVTNNYMVSEYVRYIGNWGNAKMMGEYYSIRLYNRVLTEEEIKQNYLYEQSIERG